MTQITKESMSAIFFEVHVNLALALRKEGLVVKKSYLPTRPHKDDISNFEHNILLQPNEIKNEYLNSGPLEIDDINLFNSCFHECFGKFSENLQRIPRSIRNTSILPRKRPAILTADEIRYEFHLAFTIFLRDLMEIKPDIVVFTTPPHLGYDNLLETMCAHLTQDKLVISQSIFPNRFFFSNSTENLFENSLSNFEPGQFEFSRLSEPGYSRRQREDSENNSKPNLFYMKNAVVDQSKLKLKNMINNRNSRFGWLRPRNFKAVYNFVISIAQTVTNKTVFGSLANMVTSLRAAPYRERLEDLLHLHAERHWRRELKKNIKYTDFKDVKQPYVYFPLHLQPEATTSAFGGIYVDQALAIECIWKKLPENWIIIIKENPKQNSFYRSQSFYDRIKRLDRVRFFRDSVNSVEIIRNASIVATITGTAGFEALQHGVPCIIFGNAWYKSLTGCFSFTSAIDLEKISGFNVDQDIIGSEVQDLLLSAGKGTPYSPYMEIANGNEEQVLHETATNLCNIVISTKKGGGIADTKVY